MKTAKSVKIVAVEGSCECGGPLVSEYNGSFTLPVVTDEKFVCQSCGEAHKLPKWIYSKNLKLEAA